MQATILTDSQVRSALMIMSEITGLPVILRPGKTDARAIALAMFRELSTEDKRGVLTLLTQRHH